MQKWKNLSKSCRFLPYIALHFFQRCPTCMKLTREKLLRMETDLGINAPYQKGFDVPVRNCWHFSTDGNAVDVIFYDETDFIEGMNRIYIVLQEYDVVILAFVLMDNHLHFILYGSFEECNRFMHEYVRRLSWSISRRHGERRKMDPVSISHQAVEDVNYLKTVICYTVKNPSVAGIGYNALDYPWSSGALYFRKKGLWSSPFWTLDGAVSSERLTGRCRNKVLKGAPDDGSPVRMVGPMIFPGEYVAYETVEKIYRTCKGFHYFFCKSREESVEERGGTISHLSLPMQEMRQHKNDVCQELFGTMSAKSLSTVQRLRLARVLKSRYNSSVKQIARLCGLVYDEVKELI